MSVKNDNEIALMIQHLRLKSDWIWKVSDPNSQEKYCQEALERGISLENARKALSILETMAHCQRERSPYSSSSTLPQTEEPIELVVTVGQTNFPTTIKILTADSESSLRRMFMWFKAPQTTATGLSTTSNSPELFSLILSYLTALSEDNYSNLCPDLSNYSSEQIHGLLGDCQYLGLRRLVVAINVQLLSIEKTVADDQKRLSEKLFTVSQKLQTARDEKIAIEKRLLELPTLIQRLEEEERIVEQERLHPVTRMKPQAGVHVMVNTSGSTWLKCSLVDASEVEEERNKKTSKGKKGKGKGKKPSSAPHPSPSPPQLLAKPICSFDNNDLLLPLPGRAFYHPISPIPEQLFSSPIFSSDHYLPEVLSQSLEEHFDVLLHERALDFHPTSEGRVVDLIHPSPSPSPSLFTSEVSQSAERADRDMDLPVEFFVDERGRVTIKSDINDLDQKAHPELYFDITQAFQTILPLFETTLSGHLRSRSLQVIVKAAYYFIPPGETYEGE
jgi:hypothetical protein